MKNDHCEMIREKLVLPSALSPQPGIDLSTVDPYDAAAAVAQCWPNACFNSSAIW